MEIRISKKAQKQLKLVPEYIRGNFEYWCDILQHVGLAEARKYKGYHDEPLKGSREGQRSVRLSKAYRVIYIEVDKSRYEIIEIVEVNKHDY